MALSLMAARQLVKQVYVDERVREYIVNLVLATRDPGSIKRSDLVGFVEVGEWPPPRSTSTTL